MPATSSSTTSTPSRWRPGLLLLAAALPPIVHAQGGGGGGGGGHANRDRQLAPARWWCAQPEHAPSMFCKTAVLKDAIAMAGVEEKQAKVDELRAAILAGNAEAEGLDATNPERQRMMEAWCQSDDPARTADKKSAFMCAKAKAKSEFYKRREVREPHLFIHDLFIYCLTSSARARVFIQELLAFWCGEQGHAGSPKCKQMEFGKRMSQTDSGEVSVHAWHSQLQY